MPPTITHTPVRDLDIDVVLDVDIDVDIDVDRPDGSRDRGVRGPSGDPVRPGREVER